MRYTYGIKDKREILLYKPQLFLKDKDLLIFSSKEFLKWHNGIKEYLDGLYQIDSWEIEKGNSISINELNLAVSMVNNIKIELEHLFDSKKTSDSTYYYVSTLDEKFKRIRSSYTSDMRRVDMRIPVITEEIKYKNLMEIIDEANRDYSRIRQKVKDPEDKQDKNKSH
ncbi:hypothetical protein [Methanobacterium oryzae]|uniref:hypothetical protein n=1 Tax=Methanobacterium oryzae TaxID=69540 RepID=UPI003D25189A